MEKRNFITDDLKKFGESDLVIKLITDFESVLEYLGKSKFTTKEMFLDHIECFLHDYTEGDTWDSILSEIESDDFLGKVSEYCDDKVDIYYDKISKSLPDFYSWIEESNSEFGKPEDIYKEIQQGQYLAYEKLLTCSIDGFKKYYELNK